MGACRTSTARRSLDSNVYKAIHGLRTELFCYDVGTSVTVGRAAWYCWAANSSFLFADMDLRWKSTNISACML